MLTVGLCFCVCVCILHDGHCVCKHAMCEMCLIWGMLWLSFRWYFSLEWSPGYLILNLTLPFKHVSVFFQRWSVNKPIVKRLVSNQPSAQFRLWSREVFIIMITDATWNAHASRCMSHTTGHWAAPLEEFWVGSFAQLVCFLTNKNLFLIRIQLRDLNGYLFLPLLTLIIWTHCNYFLKKCWYL